MLSSSSQKAGSRSSVSCLLRGEAFGKREPRIESWCKPGLNLGVGGCVERCGCRACHKVLIDEAKENGRKVRTYHKGAMNFGYDSTVTFLEPSGLAEFRCEACGHEIDARRADIVVSDCAVRFENRWKTFEQDETFLADRDEDHHFFMLPLSELVKEDNLYYVKLTAKRLSAADSRSEVEKMREQEAKQDWHAARMTMDSGASAHIREVQRSEPETSRGVEEIEKRSESLREQVGAASSEISEVFAAYDDATTPADLQHLEDRASSVRSGTDSARRLAEELRAENERRELEAARLRAELDTSEQKANEKRDLLNVVIQEVLETFSEWKDVFLRKIGAVGGPVGLMRELGTRLGVEDRVPESLRAKYDTNLATYERELRNVDAETAEIDRLKRSIDHLLQKMRDNDTTIRQQLDLIESLERACFELCLQLEATSRLMAW